MHHNTALPIPNFDRRSPLAILPASFISLHLLEPLDDTLILVLTQTEGHRIQTHIHTDPRIVRISEWEGGGVSLQFDLWTDWGKDVVMFLERKSKYWKVLEWNDLQLAPFTKLYWKVNTPMSLKEFQITKFMTKLT